MHKSLEIISGAACKDLTILETAKMELGIAESDISQDEKITTLIKQASSIISAYCDNMFAQETVVETFWSSARIWEAEWTSSFMLSREPVSEIVSVEIDGAILDPSEYRMANDSHLHRINVMSGETCQWTWTANAIITYTAGYVLLDDLPYGIERAALMLIKDYHSGIGRDPRVRQEDVPGVRSVTYWVGGMNTSQQGSMLPPDVIALLAPYKRLAFA
jgi:hypothetical protein